MGVQPGMVGIDKGAGQKLVKATAITSAARVSVTSVRPVLPMERLIELVTSIERCLVRIIERNGVLGCRHRAQEKGVRVDHFPSNVRISRKYICNGLSCILIEEEH